MSRFWDAVLRAIVEAIGARRLLEIGVASGLTTAKVLEYCAAADAVLYAIDPAPQVDIDEWRQRHGERFVFHQALSLEIPGDIHDIDVALIDGDHNRFTVFHELKLIEETALKNGAVPPAIALHDVDWPYGRRDLYYDPNTIPAAHRHPYRKLGLVPGEDEPVVGGVNWDLHNAINESSPRNGVRTAVEDFASQSSLDWELSIRSRFPRARDRGDARSSRWPMNRFAARSSRCAPPAFLDSWAREVERARIAAEIDANRQTLDARQAIELELRNGLEERLEQTDRLQEFLLDAERRLADVPDLEARIAELERTLADTRADAKRAPGRSSGTRSTPHDRRAGPRRRVELAELAADTAAANSEAFRISRARVAGL